MSASLRLKIGAVAAAFACLAMGTARAQQAIEREAERESGAGSVRTDIDRDTGSGQTDRARAGQADRNRTEQNRSQRNQRHEPGQRHTAGFRGTQATTSSANQQVEQYIVACLLQKNQGEIEMAKFAEQQSQNPEVKKFAQMLVQDHQQLVQKLQQLQGQEAATRPDQSLGTETRLESQRQASDTPRLPGSPGAGQPTAANEAPAIEVTPGIRDANETVSIDVQAGQGNQQNGAVVQLMAIDRAINERCAAAIKEELQQKQGAEFDMAFVGTQIGGHMHMLAALEVLGQQGPERIQQLAQQAQPKVQAHLDHAKQLIEQLKSSSASDTSQAERPQPGATRTSR